MGLIWGVMVGLLLDTLLTLVRTTRLTIEETLIQHGDTTFRVIKPSGISYFPL
jgi:hypothetical protein